MTDEQFNERDKWASVGDVIETDIQNPYPHKLRARLDTREACAHGNDLIASGRWRKVSARAVEGKAE